MGQEFRGQLSPSGPLTNRQNYTRSKQHTTLTANTVLGAGAPVDLLEITNIKASSTGAGGSGDQRIWIEAEASVLDTSALANSLLAQLSVDDGNGGAFTVAAERTVAIVASGHASVSIRALIAVSVYLAAGLTEGSFKAKLTLTATGAASCNAATGVDGASLSTEVQQSTAATYP